jgi:hypothetical protein
MALEAGQTFVLPLDAPLDINLGDMFISAAEPKFTFNRQKLLGGTLQTSVRYEDDGWFAGWWAHNFILVSNGYNRMIPSFAGPGEDPIAHDAANLIIYPRVTDFGVPFYVVKERSQGLQFSFLSVNNQPEMQNSDASDFKDAGRSAGWSYFFTGNAKFEREIGTNNDVLKIEGRTERVENEPSYNFNLVIDTYTGEIQSSSLPDDTYYALSRIEDNAIHITVDRTLEAANDWYKVRKNVPLIINDNELVYRVIYKNNGVVRHIWGYEEVDNDAGYIGQFYWDTNTSSVISDPYYIFGSEIALYPVDNAVSIAYPPYTKDYMYSFRTTLILEVTIEYSSFYSNIQNAKVSVPNEYIDGTTALDCNSQVVKIIDSVITSGNRHLLIQHSLPHWLLLTNMMHRQGSGLMSPVATFKIHYGRASSSATNYVISVVSSNALLIDALRATSQSLLNGTQFTEMACMLQLTIKSSNSAFSNIGGVSFSDTQGGQYNKSNQGTSSNAGVDGWTNGSSSPTAQRTQFMDINTDNPSQSIIAAHVTYGIPFDSIVNITLIYYPRRFWPVFSSGNNNISHFVDSTSGRPVSVGLLQTTIANFPFIKVSFDITCPIPLRQASLSSTNNTDNVIKNITLQDWIIPDTFEVSTYNKMLVDTTEINLTSATSTKRAYNVYNNSKAQVELLNSGMVNIKDVNILNTFVYKQLAPYGTASTNYIYATFAGKLSIPICVYASVLTHVTIPLRKLDKLSTSVDIKTVEGNGIASLDPVFKQTTSSIAPIRLDVPAFPDPLVLNTIGNQYNVTTLTSLHMFKHSKKYDIIQGASENDITLRLHLEYITDDLIKKYGNKTQNVSTIYRHIRGTTVDGVSPNATGYSYFREFPFFVIDKNVKTTQSTVNKQNSEAVVRELYPLWISNFINLVTNTSLTDDNKIIVTWDYASLFTVSKLNNASKLVFLKDIVTNVMTDVNLNIEVNRMVSTVSDRLTWLRSLYNTNAGTLFVNSFDYMLVSRSYNSAQPLSAIIWHQIRDADITKLLQDWGNSQSITNDYYTYNSDYVLFDFVIVSNVTHIDIDHSQIYDVNDAREIFLQWLQSAIRHTLSFKIYKTGNNAFEWLGRGQDENDFMLQGLPGINARAYYDRTRSLHWYTTQPNQVFLAADDQVQKLRFELRNDTRQGPITLVPTVVFSNDHSGFVPSDLFVYSQIDNTVEIARKSDFQNISTTYNPDLSWGSIDFTTNVLSNSTIVSFIQSEQIEDNKIQFWVGLNNSADFRIISQGIFQRVSDEIQYVTYVPNDLQYIIEWKLRSSPIYELVPDGTQTTKVKRILRAEPAENLIEREISRRVSVDKETRLNLRYTVKDIRYSNLGVVKVTDSTYGNDPNKQLELREALKIAGTQVVYQNDLTGVYQFVKQHWSNTVETENYWWIDRDHVLELTRKNITLWEKTYEYTNNHELADTPSDNDTGNEAARQGRVTDWMGDEWHIMADKYYDSYWYVDDNGYRTYVQGVWTEKEKQVPRSNFFGVQDLYYGVTSAKDSKPWIFKLQAAHNFVTNVGAIRILYIKDIKAIAFNKQVSDWNLTPPQDPNAAIPDKYWNVIEIDVYKTDFGNALIASTPPAITSYINLDSAALIAASKISATVVNGTMLLGIALDRGLSQWTVIISPSGSYNIVYGYGHVGVDGTLTGGQIPSIHCTNKGFSSTVQSIANLESIKGVGGDEGVTNSPGTIPSAPPNACYGTGSVVYFLGKTLDSIVSHYEWDATRNTHVMRTLSLRNMTERRYESSSFNVSGLFDLIQPPLSFTTLFENVINMSPGVKAVAAVLLPVLFYIDLKYVMLSYINHTFGQYCYVYRNSNKDYLPDGKTDQDLKFLQDKYTVSFEQSSDNTSWWVTLLLKAVEFTDAAIGMEYRANASQNQTTTDDSKGRKFSQFFVDNVANTVGDLIQSTGFNITLKSTISQAYTLDMFYSITDKTQCFAGPGFVNHNLTGQCVVQSIVDTQCVGKRVGYWCTLKELSRIIVELKVKVLTVLRDLLESQIAGYGSAPGPGVLGTTSGFGGIIISALLGIVAAAINALIVVQEEGLKVIEQLADAIGPSSGKAYTAGTLQKYNLAIEGTHTYGNKPMSFFYPAFGVNAKQIKYTNEWVESAGETNSQDVSFTGRVHPVGDTIVKQTAWTDNFKNDDFLRGQSVNNVLLPFKGPVKNVTVLCKGVSAEVNAPQRMAVVEGIKTFMSPTLFKNEQIGVSPVTFPPPPTHDYEIDPKWKLGFTAIGGEIVWVSCDDTKLMDGPPSNIVITSNFCGVASSYVTIEIKDLYDHRYLRPWAVTPQAIGLNINKMNAVQDTKVYHAFDGQGNRILRWAGGSGMDKAVLYQQYQFQVNDHFKRSNILPPSQFFGAFEGPPSTAMRSLAPGEPVANIVQSFARQQGIENEIPGEQKNLSRYSLPVHSELISTLPAMSRMLAPYHLHIVEGITSLTTDVRNTQTRYKAPSSVDFIIYKQTYRATEEYLCELELRDGVVAVKDIAPTAGLKYVGATTKEAFFYSPATRMYYSFVNGQEIQKVDVMNRFSEVYQGQWDFVNQEVIFKVYDMLAESNLVIRLDHQVTGEVFPPNDTLYSNKSGYRMLSMAGGTVFQGPRRFSVNRDVILDYMIPEIRYYNYRKHSVVAPLEYGKKNWKRVSRDYWDQYRDYGWKYVNFDSFYIYGDKLGERYDYDGDSPWFAIHGWTHNPYGLVTSMLGVADGTDCKFEWQITFAWTEQMEQFYGQQEYITVCLQAETVTQGGTLMSAPTRLYLHKDIFTKAGRSGYYTARYQSNNGIGNRERLYVWSDAIIAVQDLQLRAKEMTSNRTQPLITQVDVQDMIEI